MEWPMLQSLREEERAALVRLTRRRPFARNEVIFHEGDPADTLYLLARGRVRVFVTSPQGDRMTLAILGPGATFGEMAMITPGAARNATIIALDPCETLTLRREHFEALRAAHPAVDRFLVELLAERVRRLDEQLMEALFVQAEQRLLRRLVDLCELYGDGAPGTVVPLTQDTLGSMAGISRPTANQVLSALEKGGVIAVQRARIKILDPDALARRAR